MGNYSDRLTTEVRLERMRPEQIEIAKRVRPAIYVPLGSIEWHGRQNPVGLDAIKAHEQLVALAARVGGVVYPPVFFGCGGGHICYPATYMVAAQPMVAIVTDLLKGFERDGFKMAILVSGHYPNRSEFMDPAVAAYHQGGGTMRILSIVECEVPDVGGDHAAYWETSAMLHLHGETVDMSALGPPPAALADQAENFMPIEFHDHPCYGILGLDPRGRASAVAGKTHTDRLVEFFARWLDGEEPARGNGWLRAPDQPEPSRQGTGLDPG
ncbi:MAG: creatininase family protein [Planctomycetaceae bacterium]|nr:creatininase family protein [Planctomycetaceae bacterium]